MPKKPMDYSKGLIYKICCKDTNITECYVGSTTNFTKRKNTHKQCCCNNTNKNYNLPVYQFIRNNGGWENWEMVLVEKFDCNDRLELLSKEREWKENLNATLNVLNPIRYNEDNYCEHGKQKAFCKECGGGSICEHNRERSKCKECGGSSICEHNRERSKCKECGGSSICEHNKIRSKCKECGGGSICEHNKIRSNCKECGGGSICEHNRIRSRCKECGGGSICEHNRQRSTCKECKVSTN